MAGPDLRRGQPGKREEQEDGTFVKPATTKNLKRPGTCLKPRDPRCKLSSGDESLVNPELQSKPSSSSSPERPQTADISAEKPRFSPGWSSKGSKVKEGKQKPTLDWGRSLREVERQKLADKVRSERKRTSNSAQENTVFVGDMKPDTSIAQLADAFLEFGEVVNAKIIEGHCYGFVTFRQRASAERAIEEGRDVGEDQDIDFWGRPITRERKPILVNEKVVRVSWAHGSMPEWKIGVGGFIAPVKGREVGKTAAIEAARTAAAATAAAVLQGCGPSPYYVADERVAAESNRAVVAYDDLF